MNVASNASESTPTQTTTLYRHSKRTEWGLAALVWEREGKRGYQFEDGKLRVFKDGFYGLFETVHDASDSATRTMGRLTRRAKVDGVKAGKRLPSLRDQVALFLELYPRGFADPKWISDHRERDGRALKRHRAPVLELAARRLGRDALADGIEREAWAEVRDRVVEVLRKTDLVPKKHVDQLAAMEPTEELAWSIYELLHGDTAGDHRIVRFKRELARQSGPAGSWPLLAALRGLTEPNEHTCIRPSVFAVQAKMVMPAFKPPKSPTPMGYARYLQVARLVRDELTRQGHAPRDLLDVYDFIWTTLRPAAREDLERAGREADVTPAEAA
jgi:hypothetical protein